MDLVFQHQERSGECLISSRASVAKGKVISATPAFEWAVGQGVHVLLSHCATRRIKWQRRKQKHRGQQELFA